MTGSTMPFISLVVGARPNFIKAAPLIHRMKNEGKIYFQLIHTGQHYDYAMSKSFFDLFSIPEPEVNLEIGSGFHGEQTGRILLEYEKLIIKKRPDLVIVLGDVNSTLAAALASAKLHIPVAHIEAGLRSFDKTMPEEVNRVLTDHLSDLLFVTEDSAIANLSNEGVPAEGVHLTGNVMIDALKSIESSVDSSPILLSLGLGQHDYSVATLHRPSNVDSVDALHQCLALLKMAAEHGTVVFPMHPRTRQSIRNKGMDTEFRKLDNLMIIEPQGYADFMHLVKNSRFIMTDSGGIQSEASYLRTPCITLRESTEHLLTISEGTNVLTGFNIDAVGKAIDEALVFDRDDYTIPPLLDGKAAERIVRILNDYLL